jgi:hypothetical protein
MNKKLVLLGILLLVGLTLSGCVAAGGYGYGYGGYGYDYGYGYNYPHSGGYYNYGYGNSYGYQKPGRDRNDYRHGSGYGSRNWR